MAEITGGRATGDPIPEEGVTMVKISESAFGSSGDSDAEEENELVSSLPLDSPSHLKLLNMHKGKSERIPVKSRRLSKLGMSGANRLTGLIRNQSIDLDHVRTSPVANLQVQVKA